MTRTGVVRRLCLRAPAVLDACSKTGTGMGRCILSTAVGIRTLAEFGIDAGPLAVRVSAWNHAWSTLPSDATAAQRDAIDAWCVAIDSRSPAVDGVAWNGHLIIRAGDIAIDLNSGVLNRPMKGLHVPPALVFPWGPSGVTLTTVGHAVRYEPIHDRTYLTAKDWRADHTPIVSAVLRALRRSE